MANEQTIPPGEVVYADLGSAIRGVCWAWCDQHGYSDPFCRDGVWWAFPPNGVMPVQIKTVMGYKSQRLVKIGPMSLKLFPDGSLSQGFADK
ncbi:MAG: hypothetical protein AAGF93_20870 [Cyanobacteria bacterium P01_H01_bin.105]